MGLSSDVPAQKISTLTDLIYAAVADVSCWQTFLDAYVEAVGARRGTLWLIREPGTEGSVLCWSNWSEEDVRLYFERYAADDIIRISANNQPEGAVLGLEDICPAEVLETSRVYREFYDPRGIYHGFGGYFLRTTGGTSLLIANRSKQDGPFGQQAFAILHALMPHLRRAALLHSELFSVRARLATFTAHLDRYPYPFLLVDPQGLVIYANAAGKQVTERQDGLVLACGQLSVSDRKSNAQFLKAITELSAGTPLWRLDVERPSRQAPYRLILMPVPHTGAMPFGISQPAAAVLIISREFGPELDPAILRDLYSLTPAEARVTARLALGRSAEEIAEELGVSLETIRSQIRSVLSKTGTGRQGELISLVLRTAPCRRL